MIGQFLILETDGQLQLVSFTKRHFQLAPNRQKRFRLVENISDELKITWNFMEV